MKKIDNRTTQQKIEKVLAQLSEYNLWQRSQQLILKYYVLRQPPKKFNESYLATPNVQIFVQALYEYILIKCFLNAQQQKFRNMLIFASAKLKTQYLKFVNTLQNVTKKDFIIQYFYFLICLASSTILNQLIQGNIQRIDKLKIPQYFFIILINQTLGVLVSPSVYRLMKQKFIVKQYKKDNLTSINSTSAAFFDSNRKSLSAKLQHVELALSAIPRRLKTLTKNNDQYQDFKEVLKKKLQVKGKTIPEKFFNSNRLLNTPNYILRPQRKTIAQRVQHKICKQNQVNQNLYRTKSLNSNQCSSALKLSNQLHFQDNYKSIHIKFNPIYTSRFYQDKKFRKDDRWDIQLERQRQISLKKQLLTKKTKFAKKNVQSWQTEIKRMKVDSLLTPIQKLSFIRQTEHQQKSKGEQNNTADLQKSNLISPRITKSGLFGALKSVNIKVKQKQDKKHKILFQYGQQKIDQYRQFFKITDRNALSTDRVKVKPPRLEINFDTVMQLKKGRQQFNKKYSNDNLRFQHSEGQDVCKINFLKRFKDSHRRNFAKLR